ncbi:GNAT family N-acetyltransferase [bacterium]|nr:GNAT family N-acetyltransferase [bacterium]
MRIRHRTINDLGGIVELNNLCFPNSPRSLESQQFFFDNKSLEFFDSVFVAEEDDQLIGFGAVFGHDKWYDVATTFEYEVWIHPGYRKRGIAEKLYDVLEYQRRYLNCTRLISRCLEGEPTGAVWLEKKGFSLQKKIPISRLDLPTFKSGEIPAADDVQVMVYGGWDDSDKEEKLWRFNEKILLELYAGRSFTKRPIEIWRKCWNNPTAHRNSVVVALSAGEVVGMTDIKLRAGIQRYAIANFTGVLPDYRKRGIATALMTAQAVELKRLGCPGIVAWERELPEPIRRIHSKLSYAEQPAELIYEKLIAQE